MGISSLLVFSGIVYNPAEYSRIRQFPRLVFDVEMAIGGLAFSLNP
jgi:hypothetical protein